MSILVAFFFFLGIIIVGIFPFPLLYGFSNLLKFIVYRIFGYRKKVVISNLQGSFPDMSRKEIEKISGKFYKNLADVFLESIKGFTMSRKQIINRHKIINPQVIEEFYKSGQNVIGVTGHYNNWEWGSLSASLQTNYNVVALYKELNNKPINRFVLWSRSRCGTTLASIKETAATFEKYKNTKTVFLMAADQGMQKHQTEWAYWVQFLNRETPFLHGLEKYARLYNMPVVYIDIQRVKRGFYTNELSVLTENPLELQEGELTKLYAQKLESIIRKQPENWLWSHRRFKYSR